MNVGTGHPSAALDDPKRIVGLRVPPEATPALDVQLLVFGHQEAHSKRIGDEVTAIFQATDVVLLIDDEAAGSAVRLDIPH